MMFTGKLAVVVSHPIQYYAPWFRTLAGALEGRLRVFYLWDLGIDARFEAKFSQSIKWDVDLLDGYDSEQIPNMSRHPGTGSYRGLHNPSLPSRLAAWNPDVVMVFGYGWRSLIDLARNWRRCPLVLRGDSNLLGRGHRSSIRNFLHQAALRRLFRRYAAFACVGTANRDYFLRLGVPAEKLHLVPHCVDNARFGAATASDAAAWRRRNGVPAEAFVFLFAGKFEAKKRPDRLAAAFAAAGLGNAHLVLLGDGAQRGALAELAAGDSRITVLPFHNQTEMPAALRAADTLVLPSEGPGESWGLIVNEAMACGTPAIVSTHVGCAADLIVPETTGWVFPAGDQSALTRCLQDTVARIGPERERWRTATRTHIANYSYTAATEALLQMLAALGPASSSSPS